MKDFINISQKTFQDYEVETFEQLWNKVKDTHRGLSLELGLTFEKSIVKNDKDEDEEVYTMVASDDKEDRHGDIVLQEWDLKYFKKNPVLIDSHNYSSITHIIGTLENVRVEDNKLKGELKFSKANPKGQLAKEMVDEGTLRAGSVGFMPQEFSSEGKILKSELLEYSMVSVPANPRATLEKQADEKEEIIEEKIIETKTVIDKKQVLLNSIKRALGEMEEKNLAQKKREVLRALRSFQ